MNKCAFFIKTVTNEEGKTSFYKGDFCTIIAEGKKYYSIKGSNTSPTGISNFPKTVENDIFVVYEIKEVII